MAFRFLSFFLVFVLCFSTVGSASGIFFELDSTSPWHVAQRSEYVPKRDAGSQDGSFAVGRELIEFKKEYKHKSGMPIDVSFVLDHYYLRDGTSVDLPASLQRKGMSVGVKVPMPFVESDCLFIGADLGPYFQSAGEHNFSSSAFRVKSKLYGIYKPSDRFIFVAGASWRTDYEDQALMPFAGIQYIMNDQWSLHFLSNEPFIAYQANERTVFKFKLVNYNDEFEVVSGARKGDIVKMNELHAGLGLGYDISDNVSVELDMGWAFARKYEYLQNGGKVAPDDGIFAGLKISAQF